MLEVLYNIMIVLFIISFLGYISMVLIEKRYAKQNIILIQNKHLKQEDINEVDINEFIYKGERVRSGDEIKITTKENEKFNGIIIGAKKSAKSIHIITYDNEILKLKIDNILGFKVISKYGKFFNY